MRNPERVSLRPLLGGLILLLALTVIGATRFNSAEQREILDRTGSQLSAYTSTAAAMVTVWTGVQRDAVAEMARYDMLRLLAAEIAETDLPVALLRELGETPWTEQEHGRHSGLDARDRQALRDNLQGEPMLLVRLVDREQGLIVAPGNPLGIHDIADLARENVRFINRQRGSGTRVLLDYRLKQLGIRPQQLAGYEDEEYTHMNVAAAVLSGRAHTGLAVRAAACALGLDFVPVGVEEYDLVIPQRYAEDERILALLDVIRSEAFRKEVAALGGYGVEKTGQVIWEYDGR